LLFTSVNNIIIINIIMLILCFYALLFYEFLVPLFCLRFFRVSPVDHHFIGRLCALLVRVPGYRSRSPGSIAGAARFSE
jgi:hypothetical protein